MKIVIEIEGRLLASKDVREALEVLLRALEEASKPVMAELGELGENG